MNAQSLTKQALERWSYVPRSERKKLLEELTTHTIGSWCIELEEVTNGPWPDTLLRCCKARVINLAFNMDLSGKKKWRYLFKADIPQEDKE